MPEMSMELERLFIFRLSNRLLGLPLAVVREVAPYCSLTRPPSRPGCLDGFVNLRGRAVPVLRLDRLLALPETSPTVDSLLLLMQDGLKQFALVVDDALGIRIVAKAEITPIEPGAGCSDCVLSEARVPEGAALVLAPQLLLLQREQEVLAHLRDREQERLASLEGLAE